MSQVQTPRNQSIRLQKLNKTTDLYSNRSSSLLDTTIELVKLPALRAINKSVKYIQANSDITTCPTQLLAI